MIYFSKFFLVGQEACSLFMDFYKTDSCYDCKHGKDKKITFWCSANSTKSLTVFTVTDSENMTEMFFICKNSQKIRDKFVRYFYKKCRKLLILS